MPFFSKVFKGKDGNAASKGQRTLDHSNGGPVAPAKPRWGDDAWTMKTVEPEEVQELLHICTQEAKSRALDMPFLLLPFRPDSDPGSVKVFIRSFFKSLFDGSNRYRGEALRQEMRLTEPMVLCSIIKWCWSRLPGGVVTWDVYELFRIGEQDSNMARYSFKTFLPLAVDSEYRKEIIFDFFDLIAAIAARGKTNGLGGRKLSRMAGWWAFEYSDDGKGFEGGYKNWAKAADATSHLFFAYLRSLSPDATTGISGISALPRSLQALLQQTEYPPETPTLMQTTTTKVVMIVDSVSPTPFALLRRAKHFEYRADDLALQQWSDYEDPVQALTPECRRVLYAISSTNQSAENKQDNVSSLQRSDASWSRFEDMGFSALNDDFQDTRSMDGPKKPGLRTTPASRPQGGGRPTTPSWADFLSSGFNEEPGQRNGGAPMLLPPDKQLPPINGARAQSSQSHVRHNEDSLEPGELASITHFDLDETFWWVWMTSLAGEEPDTRKAAFGRCALIETKLGSAKWLVMEEQVKGASPGPEEGAYIAEKKSRFTFSKRGKLGRRKSDRKKAPQLPPKDAISRNAITSPNSKVSLAPSQHAKIQAAAAALAEEKRAQEQEHEAQRRGRTDDAQSTKTNSVFTLQPVIMSEAAPAMKWAKEFDKDRIRAQYLGDSFAGKGIPRNLQSPNGSGFSGNFSGSRTPETASIMALEAMAAKPPVPPAKDTEESAPAPPPVPKDEPPTSQPAEDSSSAPHPNTFPPDEKRRPIRDTSAAAGLSEPHPSEQHPAFRQQPSPAPAGPQSPTDDHATIAAKRAAQKSKKTSPEVSKPQKESPNKLKKKDKGGLRKLFSKKKPKDIPQGFTALDPVEPEVPTSEHPAYQQKPIEQQDSGVSSPHDVNAPYGFENQPQGASYSDAEPEAPAADQFDDPHHRFGRHDAQDEQEQAEHEFSRFDQGPLDDQPAFAPRGSMDEDDAVSNAPSSPSPAAHRRPVGMATSVGQENIPPHRDDESNEDNISEASFEQAKPAQIQDRWAQIRKNAAERQRQQSEDASRPSQSGRTDDGETSGEETIESRVARIKARVAELTGNMDSHGNIQTGR
ncbi:MAG: hypothetical protein M1822_002484 [Bathelium mastoideum]|nr:MAG: hypothetical protein M1822_002484 [Bathelium mastoideum]